MNGRPIKRVQNYTNAFLVSFYVLLLMLLMTIWATYDFLLAFGLGIVAHLYLSHRLRQRELTTAKHPNDA